MIFSAPWEALAGPHLGRAERAASQLAAELLEKIMQGDAQVMEHLRSKPNNDEPADRCRAALALQRANQVAQKFQPRGERGPEIDERCNGSAIRKQGFLVKVRKDLVGDAEAVGPNQPIVSFDTPTIRYLSPGHLLAMCSTTQHEPLKRKQLCSRRKFDVCLPAKSSPIKHDRFLRQPCEFCDLAGFQLCRDARGFVQGSIDLFSGL